MVDPRAELETKIKELERQIEILDSAKERAAVAKVTAARQLEIQRNEARGALSSALRRWVEASGNLFSEWNYPVENKLFAIVNAPWGGIITITGKRGK